MTFRTCSATTRSTTKSWKPSPERLPFFVAAAIMRVLGIDCGTERTGFGVIETNGVSHCMIASGVIRTSPSDDLHLRLATIASGLRALIQEHTPDAVAVEEVFHSINTKS